MTARSRGKNLRVFCLLDCHGINPIDKDICPRCAAGKEKPRSRGAKSGRKRPNRTNHLYGLLQIEWVKRSGFSQVDNDSKGFLVNLPVTGWPHVCAHAKIDQDETPER